MRDDPTGTDGLTAPTRPEAGRDDAGTDTGAETVAELAPAAPESPIAPEEAYDDLPEDEDFFTRLPSLL